MRERTAQIQECSTHKRRYRYDMRKRKARGTHVNGGEVQTKRRQTWWHSVERHESYVL